MESKNLPVDLESFALDALAPRSQWYHSIALIEYYHGVGEG
jgi:hypothetical protein